jgi:hypothetical protein
MRWHELWRVEVDGTLSENVIGVTAREHEGRTKRLLIPTADIKVALGLDKPQIDAVALAKEILEDAELFDDDTCGYGYRVSPSTINKLKEIAGEH